MLVQTLFYGLFSGWMLWRQEKLPAPRQGTGPGLRGPFDWKDASDFLALPLMGDLFDEIAKPRRLADLDLREPLQWATTSLNRVDEEEFFKRFDAEHAITVIKKWLSYREHKVLGRPLRLDELTYITEVIRRLKALLLLGSDLDSNYRAACK